MGHPEVLDGRNTEILPLRSARGQNDLILLWEMRIGLANFGLDAVV